MVFPLIALLAAVLSFAGAGPKPSPQEKDKDLVQIIKAYTGCERPPIDVDALLADPAKRPAVDALGFDETEDAVYYVSCRALMGTGPGCKSLAGLEGRFKNAQSRCEDLKARALLTHSALRGGDAVASCKAGAVAEGKAPAAAEAGCAALVNALKGGDVMRACPALEAQGLVKAGACKADMAYWSAKPEACALFKDPLSVRLCRENGALVAGLREPSKCASSFICMALEKKSAAACEGLRASFSGAFCAERDRIGGLLNRMLTEEEKNAKVREANEAKIKERVAKEEEKRKAALSAAPPPKRQFKKNEPMKDPSRDLMENMRKIEKGENPNPQPSGE